MKKLLILLVTGCWILASLPVFAQDEDATSPGKSVRDQLRERIEERLAELQNKPRATIGKIADIQNSSLLIETNQGMRQVKLSEETQIVGTKDDNKKTLQQKDLKIGDIVTAMGYQKTKDILDAQRILVLEEMPKANRRSIYGIVESKTKDTVIIKHPKTSETWTIKTTNKTKVTGKVDNKIENLSFPDIEEQDRIVAVGKPTKNGINTLSANLIHIIPGKAKGLAPIESGLTKPPSPSPKPTPKE